MRTRRIAAARLVLRWPPARSLRQAPAPRAGYVVNDSHFHLTNYVQEGTDIHDFLKIMGDKVGRVALFGIPLQQTWSYGNTGDFAPDLLPADRRAALLLLVHRRLHRDGLPLADARRSRRASTR